MSTPKKRSLTDELQSVLRAHALEAPEPAATIDAVLARTVGATSEVPVAGKAWRWFTPMRTVLVAGAAAAVVAAVGVPILLTSQHRTQSTAEKAGGSALTSSQAQDRAAQAPPSDSANKQYGVQGSLPLPQLAEGAPGMPTCGAADLTVSLLTTNVKAPTVALVRVTNSSAGSCLVAGFPDVTALPSGAEPTAPSASVTSGAVAEPVPTLVLAPGTSATAAVDVAAQPAALDSARSCDVSSVRVAVPNVPAKQFPFDSTACAFQVHPFVAAK